MKKIAIFIIATISFICLYNIPTYAATLNQLIANNTYENLVYMQSYWNDDPNQGIVYYVCGIYGSGQYITDNRVNNDNDIYLHKSNYTNYDYYRFNQDPFLNPDLNTNVAFSTNSTYGFLAVNIRGNFIDNSNNELVFESVDEYDDYLNPPPEPLTWYEELFNDFIDYIYAGIGGGINGFVEWLQEAWVTPVGEGEDELAIDLITPPPPTPTPTPIPYQTVLQPDNNGGYQIQYIYPDPSGNPTSAPQPPNNTNINNNYGSNFEYPYYDNKTNKDDPYVLDIPWYLRFIFKGQTTSLSDFQDGIDATIETVNNSEEQINTVMDSMSIFPSEWLLMIGFIGAIPLVGGIISRLLKG